MPFEKASMGKIYVKEALFGEAGTGKTFTALNIAKHTIYGAKTVVIDTENKASRLFANQFEFDIYPLTKHTFDGYQQAFQESVDAKYEFIIIDSFSHLWKGQGGILDELDKAAKNMKGNQFGAWKTVNPKIEALVQYLVAYPVHLIVTFRSNSVWQWVDKENGKKELMFMGFRPQFKKGQEFEFDIACQMDRNNTMHVIKSRCTSLQGKSFQRPGKEVGDILRSWILTGDSNKGAALPPPPVLSNAPELPTEPHKNNGGNGKATTGTQRQATTQKPPITENQAPSDTPGEEKKDLRKEIIRMINEVMDFDYPLLANENDRESKFQDILRDITAGDWKDREGVMQHFYGHTNVYNIKETTLGLNYGKVKAFYKTVMDRKAKAEAEKASNPNEYATEDIPF